MNRLICRLTDHAPRRQPIWGVRPSVPCRCGRYYHYCDRIGPIDNSPGAVIHYEVRRELLKGPRSTR